MSLFASLLPSRRQPLDLRRSLMLRVALVAVACFALIVVVLLLETRSEAAEQRRLTADRVARHLTLQLLRIDAGFDSASRFPDWDAVLGNSPLSGLCVRVFDLQDRMIRGNCIGSLAAHDQTPAWFAFLHGQIFGPEPAAESLVTTPGDPYGKVVVTSESLDVIGRTWREMKHLLALTALTIFALSGLVYIAIGRALAPTRELVAGLNRLADGDFASRLPGFHLSELQRISEVSNLLAARIESDLRERADLSRRLVNAQEDERRHLARELHDEFAQNLTAISALAASIEKTAARDCPALLVEARGLSGIAGRMMTALRGTLLHLRPAELERFGLEESLRQLVAVWNAGGREGTRFLLELPEPLPPLPDSSAVHLFRIAQEGLTNAARHAEASRVRLRVEPSLRPRAGIRLTLEDDGKGREQADARAAGQGMGLLNMRERVAALGGSLAFEDRPGGGLILRVEIPLSDPEAEAA